jgi:hypothetical protein
MNISVINGICKSIWTDSQIDYLMKNCPEKIGNCVIDSWITWQKLFKCSPKRVRGLINNLDIIAGTYEKHEHLRIHYWVESGGMVYDCSPIHSYVIAKDEYYEIFRISDEEYSENGVFKENYKNINGPDDVDELEKNIIPQMKKKIRFI